MSTLKSKIAILTTVANFELYQKTSIGFPEGIKRFVIDGTNRMYGIDSIVYMISKFKNLGFEWLIMADEDVIFYQPNEVFSIIELMNIKGFTVSGVRDGGVIKHRNHNPFVVNTFFSILNIKHVLQIWNRKEMLKNQYCIQNEFNDNLNLHYTLNKSSLFEPYYCFYLWLRRNNKKFLFLDTKMEADGIANTVWFNDVKVLCHTWYARNYGIDPKNTKRIENYLAAITTKTNLAEKPVVFKDKFFILKRLYKRFKRIPEKINTILVPQ